MYMDTDRHVDRDTDMMCVWIHTLFFLCFRHCEHIIAQSSQVSELGGVIIPIL